MFILFMPFSLTFSPLHYAHNLITSSAAFLFYVSFTFQDDNAACLDF